MSLILNLSIMFGIVTMIFFSPALMSVGLVRMSNDKYSIELSEVAKCSIPIYTNFYGNYRYSGSWMSMSGIANIIMYVSLIARLYVMYFKFDNIQLQTYTIYFFLISVLVYWILNAIDVYKVLRDSGLYKRFSCIFNSFAFIIGQILIGYYLPRQMNYYYSKNNKGDLYGRS